MDGIHLNWVDRIPLDLYLALALAIGSCVLMLGIDATGVYFVPAAIFLAILLALAVLLVMSVLMTLSTRFKSGAFWKNTIVYRCLCLLFRMGRGLKAVSYTHLA